MGITNGITNKVTRFALKIGMAGLLSLSAWSITGNSTPALAHDGDCSVCSLPIVQNTASQDNEVILKYGRKRVEYRCVYCALADAQGGEYKNDLSIVAPSEKKGKPVVIKRVHGKWSASPTKAVFVGAKVSHRHCQTGYRALTSRTAFNAYVKKNKKVVNDAKPLTLKQMVALADPG